MVQLASRPNYKYSPVQSCASLSKVLAVSPSALKALAANSNNLYRLANPILKPDGSVRQPYDALYPLKLVHERLKLRVFAHVSFPDYLTGSLKGKDAIKNASFHAGAKIVVCEDIKDFFPSVTADVVYSIWQGFFNFAPEVSRLLTSLCTKDGSLPQGAITSSYLANLVFWKQEWRLYEDLKSRGIVYSRYVDDVTVSSREGLDKEQLSECIGKVYGLMAANGLRPKRKKQEIQRAHAPMRATKLMVNKRAALSLGERKAIRAAVHQLELEVAQVNMPKELMAKLNSVSGRVARLAQLHVVQGNELKNRIRALRVRIKLLTTLALHDK
ncbi:reverse transcriptase family protein [Dyella psychrodurans]|uniref:RNA-directed DNA polymerase n=1 Tax=Dyella psychrodurans TaxID=1927960 RepID=A0A370WY71_9GAMM|nr:reverse transcriptase family protein [Dyella psychrodurans]RDS80961.1 RNA-directed DNA polymerase [Dyella psychrodurans]